MATKAQMARYWNERAGPKRTKSPPRARRDVPVDTSRPGVSATDRRAAQGPMGSRNWSKRAGKNAAYALEPSSGKPSRRSTRASLNRLKATGMMQGVRRGPKPR